MISNVEILSLLGEANSTMLSKYRRQRRVSPISTSDGCTFPTFEYVMWHAAKCEWTDSEYELRAWYEEQREIHVIREAPPVETLFMKNINVYFINEHKQFFNKLNKKMSGDYIINIDKLIEEKFGARLIILNTVQSFLLNYEIRKMLDKAIRITNAKYDNIVYINADLNEVGIINIIAMMRERYQEVTFNYVVLDPDGQFSDTNERCPWIFATPSLFKEKTRQ